MKSTPEKLQYWKDYRIRNRERYRQYYSTVREKKKAQYKVWVSQNKDRRSVSDKKYRAQHPDRVRARNLKWRRKNAESLRIKQRNYAIKNASRIKSYMRAFHKRHYAKPEVRKRILEQTKAYATLHPEVRRNAHKRWISKHPEQYRAHLKHSRMVRRAKMSGSNINPGSIRIFISGVKSKPSSICYYCRKRVSTKRINFDHMTPLSKGGPHSVENLCVSCERCNQTKHTKLLREFVTLGQQLLEL